MADIGCPELSVVIPLYNEEESISSSTTAAAMTAILVCESCISATAAGG